VNLLVFDVHGERYAIPVADIRELIRAVAIARLPGAPDVVEGVIDLRGAVVPIFDLRRRFGLPPLAVALNHSIVIANAGSRVAGFRADTIVGLQQIDTSAVESPESFIASSPLIAGVARLPDGLVLIHDLASFLSEAESLALDSVLPDVTPAPGAPAAT
jgi:purine-binding chemotaxis protein CheW